MKRLTNAARPNAVTREDGTVLYFATITAGAEHRQVDFRTHEQQCQGGAYGYEKDAKFYYLADGPQTEFEDKPDYGGAVCIDGVNYTSVSAAVELLNELGFISERSGKGATESLVSYRASSANFPNWTYIKWAA